MGKKLFAAVCVIIFALGVWTAIGMIQTVHRDYKDFKLMRAWIVRAEQERQQKAKPAPSSVTPPVAPQSGG